MFALALLTLSLLSTPRCIARGHLPDPLCSPGDVETTSLAVICGRRASSRRHVDAAVKRRVLAEYGVPWLERASFEVDHVVPLCLGGSNAISNLWPQPIVDARVKDAAEVLAHREVCSGRTRVSVAQAAFAHDWRTVR